MDSVPSLRFDWTVLAWGATLLVGLTLTVRAVVHARVWRWPEPTTRAAVIDLLVLCLVGFAVRSWATEPIVLDWFTYPLPDAGRSGNLRAGPGFGVFANLCYLFGGISRDSVTAGANVVGALTVVPVYLLVRAATGGRAHAIAAGATLALLAPHVRMTNAADPAALVAFLGAAALALAEARRATGVASFALPAALCGALAATTRPEMMPAFIVLLVLLLRPPKCSTIHRTIHTRTALYAGLPCIALAAAGLFVASQQPPKYWGLQWDVVLGAQEMLRDLPTTLAVLPPTAPLAVGGALLLGVIVAWRVVGLRAVAWVLFGLAPVATWCALMAVGTDVGFWALVALGRSDTSAGLAGWLYLPSQSAALPVAAALIGIGGGAIWEWSSAHLPRARTVARPAMALLGVAVLGLWLSKPPPLPTYVLSFQFYQREEDRIPDECTLVVPGGREAHEENMRLGDLRYIRPTTDLDPGARCLIFWKPPRCSRFLAPDAWLGRLEAVARIVPAIRDVPLGILPPRECSMIENSYDLEPIAEAVLPGRQGNAELFEEPTVQVGFYRLRPLRARTGKGGF